MPSRNIARSLILLPSVSGSYALGLRRPCALCLQSLTFEVAFFLFPDPGGHHDTGPGALWTVPDLGPWFGDVKTLEVVHLCNN